MELLIGMLWNFHVGYARTCIWIYLHVSCLGMKVYSIHNFSILTSYETASTLPNNDIAWLVNALTVTIINVSEVNWLYAMFWKHNIATSRCSSTNRSLLASHCPQNISNQYNYWSRAIIILRNNKNINYWLLHNGCHLDKHITQYSSLRIDYKCQDNVKI